MLRPAWLAALGSLAVLLPSCAVSTVSSPIYSRAEIADEEGGRAEGVSDLVDLLRGMGNPLDESSVEDSAVSPQDMRPINDPRKSPQRRNYGSRYNRWDVNVFWVPASWIKVQEDASTGTGESDLNGGAGWGARVGVTNGNQGIGLMYVGSFNQDDSTKTDADTHAAYIDFMARHQVNDGTNRAYLTVAGGLGGVRVDYRDTYDSSTGGAFMMRAALEWEIGRHAGVDFGIAGFVWGHPGDTIGYGSYFTVGGKFMF